MTESGTSYMTAIAAVEEHLLGRMEDGTYVAPHVQFTAREIRERLWELYDAVRARTTPSLDEWRNSCDAEIERLVDAAMSVSPEPFSTWRYRMTAALRAAAVRIEQEA